MLNAQTISFVVTDATCAWGIDGAVDATVTGGQPPYQFSWSNSSNDEDLINVPAGSYTLTVTDANLLQFNDMATVGQNIIPLLVDNIVMTGWDNDAHFPCPDQCNGQFGVGTDVIGGTPPYDLYMGANGGSPDPQYIYTFNNVVDVFDGICSDETYWLNVSDANGCVGYDADVYDLFLFAPSAVIPVINTTPATNGLANGSADIDVGTVNSGYQTLQVYDGQFNLHSEYLSAIGVINVPSLAFDNYTARVIYDLSYGSCFDDFNFFILDSTIGGMVQGIVFNDENSDCIQDQGDAALPGMLLRFDPGPEYAISNYDGSYQFVLPYGNYDLSQTSTAVTQICPAGAPVNFDLTQIAPIATIDLADTVLNDLDMQLMHTRNAARPGFVFRQTLLVKNLSADSTGQVTLSYTKDIELQLDSSSAAYSVNGNDISWNLPSLSAFQENTVHVYFTLGTFVPIGTVLNNSGSVECSVPELPLANNIMNEFVTVVGSYDPNDKLSNPEGSFVLQQDSVIDYTIRFQNTGTDTAFTVVVTDTLSVDLDISTLQIGAGSNPFEYSLETGRVLKFTFEDILLPDSNVNEAASHGFVGFRIRPVDGLMVGNMISNTANIFFDFNAPVITDPNILIIDGSTGIADGAIQGLILFPNPARDVVYIQARSNALIEDVQLIDPSGRILEHRSMINTSGSELSLKGRSSGLYFIRVECTDGSVLMGSVSVQ